MKTFSLDDGDPQTNLVSGFRERGKAQIYVLHEDLYNYQYKCSVYIANAHLFIGKKVVLNIIYLFK
jgi:hypothetical protein